MIQVLARLAPSVLVIAVAVRIHRIQRAFIEVNATSPDQARTLSALRIRGFELAFKLLRRRGVVVPIGERYYLDLEARERWHRRRRIVVPIVVAILIVTIGGFLLFQR